MARHQLLLLADSPAADALAPAAYHFDIQQSQALRDDLTQVAEQSRPLMEEDLG